MSSLAEEAGIARVGLPRIGAGLGGLPWPDVRSLLATFGEQTRVELLLFERYAPAV